MDSKPDREGERTQQNRVTIVKIKSSDSGPKLKASIKAFYDARKDRRIAHGYTPSDKVKDDH